jgi:hypothetical protein
MLTIEKIIWAIIRLAFTFWTVIAFIIVLVVVSLCHAEGFRLYPEGKKVEVSIEHEMFVERDTVTARHWHKVDGGWYVIRLDSVEIWCDAVKEIK